MGLAGVRNQEQLCRRGPAVIYWTGPAWIGDSAVQGERPVVVRTLFSSKRRAHFIHVKVGKEQKYGPGSRRGPKPEMTVLARASSNLAVSQSIVTAPRAARDQNIIMIPARLRTKNDSTDEGQKHLSIQPIVRWWGYTTLRIVWQ
jgi:hypothetical protein